MSFCEWPFYTGFTQVFLLFRISDAMPEEIEVKNGDGSTAFKCWDMDGLYLPLRCKDPVKRLKDINEMEYKDGDIHIVSYPKVGRLSWPSIDPVPQSTHQ